MNPKVFVIILNYKRPEDTLECIASVLISDYSNFEIVIVDNASEDQSCGMIRRKYPQLTLIENKSNLGYAGGNNQGILHALHHGADYVLILNNDAVVKIDTLSKLVEAGDHLQSATLIAPKIYYYDRPEIINSVGTQINWLKLRPWVGPCGKPDNGKFRQNSARVILPGAALLLKRKLFEQVGLFNEDFFLLHEDADLCFRNLKAGFSNILAPQAVVYHKISRTLSSYPFLSEYYSTRNFLYLSKKHASLPERMLTSIGIVLFTARNLLLYIFQPSMREKCRGFFAGVRDFHHHQKGVYQGPLRG